MLDFDGVLHPAQGSDSPEFGFVGLLEEALENQDCAIVVSSTWREHYSLQALRERLGPALGRCVVGALGPDLRGPHVRYKNILAWLDSNPWCREWRALDDTASEFPVGCEHLILCDGRTGLRDEQMRQLRTWLEA
jgi:hypothetical protein